MSLIKLKLELFIDGVSEFKSGTPSRTATGGNSFRRKITVTQAAEIELIIPTDIGNVREFAIRNDDATNYVDYGFATGVYPCRLNSGDSDKISLSPATASIFLIANVADCLCEVLFLEE